MKAIWIRRIYHTILTIALLAAGGCLIWGCLNIYLSGGEQIYTLEKISSTFRTVAVPVYLAAALAIGSFILELFLPAPKKKKGGKNEGVILRNLQSRADLDKCGDKELCRVILSLRRQRKALGIISAALLAVTTVIFLLYALNGHNFHQSDFNGSMIRAALVWAVCLAIPFLFSLYGAYAGKASVRTEIELLKKVALGKKPDKLPVKNNQKTLNIVRISVIAAAAVLILVGALGGGWVDVLTKAAAICTECVGLG